jgi:hypothetical protein
MLSRSVFLVFVTALLAGCVSAEEQRARDEDKCRSYGFTKRNDAFAACLQRIDIARQQNLQANDYYGWYGPPIYAPVVRRGR